MISQTQKALSASGYDPESREWIERQLEALHNVLPVYRKKRNRKWIMLTEQKIQFYTEKLGKKKVDCRSLSKYGHWTEESINYLVSNAGTMTEKALAFEIGLSRTAIHTKKLQLGL